MLLNCDLSSPCDLWENHKDDFCEDTLHQVPNVPVQLSENIHGKVLLLLEGKVLQVEGKQVQEYSLPRSTHQDHQTAQEIVHETSYEVNAPKTHIVENEPKLLPEERAAYNCILESAQHQKGGLFFLDAPGGTGKTFLTNLLWSRYA